MMRGGHSETAARAWIISVGSILTAAGLVLGLYWLPVGTGLDSSEPPLVVYCAAVMKAPMEEIVRAYEQEHGRTVQLQFGGSGLLLSNIRIVRLGDLYLAADGSYIRKAREQQLVNQTFGLALIRPVIAVRQSNPKTIRTLGDLLRDDVTFALANPDAAAIGRTVRSILQTSGQWEQVKRCARVFKPTVTDVVNDIKLGSVDAGIVWDATAHQYPELEIVRVPGMDAAVQEITVGVLTCSRQPVTALHFARYLRSEKDGLAVLRTYRYEPVDSVGAPLSAGAP